MWPQHIADGVVIILTFIVFLQDGNDGDPVLGPHRPPLLSGACYDGRRLQVSPSDAAQSLLLDQRDVRSAKRHRLRLNPHQLPGSHDQHSEFSFDLQFIVCWQNICRVDIYNFLASKLDLITS